MTAKGTKQPIETILKRIASRKGYKHSPETRAKLCLARKGYRPSRESILKGVESRKWYRPSQETKNKIGDGNRGKKHTPENILKQRSSHLGQKGYWTGKKMSKEHAINIGKAHLGQKAWNKGLKGFRAGAQSHLWKGGITPENCKIRHSFEMVCWRKACMERDNFTCQKTGERGGKLRVHHINNFADFPELRTSIENGITLSEKTHKEFHVKYGTKNNTREQLEEFLGKKI